MKITKPIHLLSLLCISLCFFNNGCLVYQRADLENTKEVTVPAYTSNGPMVLFDEGHNNFHTASGRYEPFVRLIASDGYRIETTSEPFSLSRLSTARLLVIANATSPFAATELSAVEAWVESGGALLLISDHPPYAAESLPLANRFGVHLSNAWTVDMERADPDAPSATWIRYQREDGALGEHPILQGRYPEERLRVVVTFAGQSLHAAQGEPLLLLSDQARDYETRKAAKDTSGGRSAKGRAQAVAVQVGKGRVVVVGEAAMLTSQVGRMFFKKLHVGFNRPGNDNRQFVLNIVHWLTGLL